MILVFDTETTGLPLHPTAPLNKQPKIIEFGAALLSRDTGEIVDEINILIDPGEPLEEIITKITGLRDEDLVGCPDFAKALPEIEAFFSKATSVVAHNLPFDKSLLSFELARMELSLDEFAWPDVELCTVGAFQEIWGRRPKLIELYQWSLGRELAQTHRAIDDVKALVEVIQKEELWKEL